MRLPRAGQAPPDMNAARPRAADLLDCAGPQLTGNRLANGRLLPTRRARRRVVVGPQAVEDPPRLIVAGWVTHRHQVAAGLHLALVVLGLVLGQAHADEGPDQPAGGRPARRGE